MILGCNIQVINITKSFLSKNFKIEDFGDVDVILGIKLLKSNNDFVLTQSHYIEKILKRFNYFDMSIVCSPFDPFTKLRNNDGESVSLYIFSYY
jgi:hypothetical protein